MKIVFLGTGSMQPTRERSHTAIYISGNKENFLVDCGEGTQRQILLAGLKTTKISRVLLTHWHGDHVFGLPGLLTNMAVNEYPGILEVYGPAKTIEHIKHMYKSYEFNQNIKIKINEIREGKIFASNEFNVYAVKLKHSSSCYGYRIEEKNKIKINLDYLKQFGLKQDPLLGKLQNKKDVVWKGNKIKWKDATYVKEGKKVAIILDTGMCNDAVKLARNADVLICESTFSGELATKADRYTHLTAEDAGKIAKKAGVKKLILTHFSQRYKDTTVLKEEAKKIFENVECAKDFMEIKV